MPPKSSITSITMFRYHIPLPIESMGLVYLPLCEWFILVMNCRWIQLSHASYALHPGNYYVSPMICPAFSEVGYVSSFPGESYLSLLSFPSFLSTKSELCHKHQCYLVCPQPPNHQQVDAGHKACKCNVDQPQSGPLRVPVLHAWKLTSWTQKWRLGRWFSFSYGWFWVPC